MKKLFLIIISVLLVFDSYSCGGYAYTQEEHKHFLIPNLFTNPQYRKSLIATTNNLHYNIDYNIYNAEKDQLIRRRVDLGISESTIKLMHTEIVESVYLGGSNFSLVFKDDYNHNKVKIYDLNIDDFYPQEVKVAIQILALNYNLLLKLLAHNLYQPILKVLKKLFWLD